MTEIRGTSRTGAATGVPNKKYVMPARPLAVRTTKLRTTEARGTSRTGAAAGMM